MDCGTVFTHSGNDVEFKADFTLKMMDRLGYDVMNVGIFDIRFLRKHLLNGVVFPAISTNLRGDFPYLRKYYIQEVSGVRVGILGILSPEDLTELVNPQGLQIEDPVKALREVLPKIRPQTDFVVLLSQMDWEDTMGLLNKVEGIDTAISCSQEGVHSRPAGDDEPLCHLSKGGHEVGRISLKETNGEIGIASQDIAPTDDSVLADREIKALVEKTLYERKKYLKRQREMETRQKLLEGLKMSPADFIETMNDKEGLEP